MPEAFKWIVDIFHKHDVTFLVSGGLAAYVHGSPRAVRDLNFDIEEGGFTKIMCDVTRHITQPPRRHTSRAFENMLMELDYNGTEIDIASIAGAKVYDDAACAWIPDETDLSRYELKTVFGIEVPVARREDLIAYKSHSPRPEDLADIEALKARVTNK